MFKIATLLQACLGLHHPEIYPILVLMHSRFKKGVLPIIRLPAEAIKFAPAYFFCRRKYKWTSKMIWRSFDNLKKPPRLLYAFSFDGYSASTTTAFSIQEHLTIRNWHKRKRVNRYKKVERQSRSTFFSVIKSSNKIKFKDNRYIAIT